MAMSSPKTCSIMQMGQKADSFLIRLGELQDQHAMRMPTVADRLGERFIRPMHIDRIRALVRPAMEEARQGKSQPAFQLLRKKTQELTREPTGVGLDVPAWLMALEEEVELNYRFELANEETDGYDSMIPRKTLSLKETERLLDELEEWAQRKR